MILLLFPLIITEPEPYSISCSNPVAIKELDDEEAIVFNSPVIIADLSLLEWIEPEIPESTAEKSELPEIILCDPAPITELKLLPSIFTWF